jgi:hypothetical protein
MGFSGQLVHVSHVRSVPFWCGALDCCVLAELLQRLCQAENRAGYAIVNSILITCWALFFVNGVP